MRARHLRRISLLALLLPAVTMAQDRTIRGVVVDSAGKGVPFAVVTATASERSVEADENGRFRLQVGQFETCALQVRRLRYRTASITLDPCPDSALRIVLTRVPYVDDSGPRCGTRSTAVCEARGIPRIASISAGYAHTCAVEPNGTAWCWGDGGKLALGDGRSAVQRWPQRVTTAHRFNQMATGGSFACGMTPDGTVLCWGTSEVAPRWPHPTPEPLAIGTFGTGARLTAGRRHACVLDASGRASCWGWNVDGETGTGSSGIASSLVATPTAVLGDHRFLSISAGSNFTCGVIASGRLLCWGNNVDGVLGDQTAERCGDVNPVPCSARPVEVKAPEPMRHVSSGTSHACSVSASGTVYCWGANDHGQLGHVGPPVGVPQRVTVNGSQPFRTVESGGIETCAITTTNALYCWGADYRSTRVSGLSREDVQPRHVANGIRSVAMGQLHSCLVTTDDLVRCWGDTIMGAFGVR
jgi:alpha-tubulin suppressor-like RCC1 family protein